MLGADSSRWDPKIRVESWVGAEDTVSCTPTQCGPPAWKGQGLKQGREQVGLSQQQSPFPTQLSEIRLFP